MSCCEDGPGTPLKPADYAKAGFRLNPQHSTTCLLRCLFHSSSYTPPPAPVASPYGTNEEGSEVGDQESGIRTPAESPSLRWACASDTPRPPSPGDRSDREGQGGGRRRILSFSSRLPATKPRGAACWGRRLASTSFPKRLLALSCRELPAHFRRSVFSRTRARPLRAVLHQEENAVFVTPSSTGGN